jgi:adenine/guanine phosphoribosyltransferase-like PRPP-binding protein
MKSALIFIAAAGFTLAASVATAQETRIGVGVGPVGAGVTVGQSPSYERRTTVIREREPRDETVVIRKERREPRDKVIIRERD